MRAWTRTRHDRRGPAHFICGSITKLPDSNVCSLKVTILFAQELQDLRFRNAIRHGICDVDPVCHFNAALDVVSLRHGSSPAFRIGSSASLSRSSHALLRA